MGVVESPYLVVELPGQGLAWSDATRAVPGARVDFFVEGSQVRDGHFQLDLLAQVDGLPADGLAQVQQSLTQRYSNVRFEEVPSRPGTRLLRTSLSMDEVQSTSLRFLLRFEEFAHQILVSIEAGRICLRARPIKPEAAQETALRIQGFLEKQRIDGRARVTEAPDCACRDPRQALRPGQTLSMGAPSAST